MARYFQGNTLASFSRNTPAEVFETTTAGRFDSFFVSSAIGVLGHSFGSFYAEGRLNANATGNFWLHFEHMSTLGSSAVDSHPVTLLNSAGVPIFRLRNPGNGNTQGQYWNGSTWVSVGATPAIAGSINRYDLRYTPGNGGSFDLYISGSLVASASGFSVDGGVVADVRSFRLSSFVGASSATSCYSQVLAADFDTRDSRYRMPLITANGALTDGTGGFADINETVLDDSTAIRLTASGQRKTFIKAAIAVPAGYRIGAMGVSARGRVTGVLTDGQLSVRLDGVNYDSASLGFNAGYEPRSYILENNPGTAAAWTQAEFNAAEPGIEAV
jgi:hypothetical protein